MDLEHEKRLATTIEVILYNYTLFLSLLLCYGKQMVSIMI